MASIPLPNGAQIALATTFGAAQTISAISNANPAVAAAASHTYTDGDIILLSNSWTKTDNGVFRVDGAVAGTSVEIEGLNSTDVGKYPASGGAGSAREITAWTQLPKIPTFDMTGGDPKSLTTSYIDYEKDFEIFTGTNPERLNFTISYQPDSPAYAALVAAGESGVVQVVRLVLKDGSTLFYPGQLFFNKAPVMTKDQEMVNNVSLALQGEITRYAKLVP
jgi:hypothetical protein